ncbi:glycoside hydrolase family 26 protein [Paracoccus liaowanqingii]|nr:glycosyl hydrolase [Paracoccus liaowanqingii]
MFLWVIAAAPVAANTTSLRAAELRTAVGGGQPLLVVASGNDPANAAQFERWLERPVDGVQLHNGREDWADWTGSIGWLIDVWSDQTRPIFWSIQLLPKNGASLIKGAAGAYDSYYAEAGRLLSNSQPQGPIFVRIGWEFNGDWMPWAAAGQEKAYVSTYRNLVAQFRLHSNRFVFEWSPNVGDYGMDPGTAWPGDDVVDIVGIDFYYHPEWNSSDPQAAWDHMVTQPYGLAWHRDFAAARGKPRAFSEWGVALDTSGPYVSNAAAWFNQDDVVYQSYWNSDADFPGKLSDRRMPLAGAAYREMFGN